MNNILNNEFNRLLLEGKDMDAFLVYVKKEAYKDKKERDPYAVFLFFDPPDYIETIKKIVEETINFPNDLREDRLKSYPVFDTMEKKDNMRKNDTILALHFYMTIFQSRKYLFLSGLIKEFEIEIEKNREKLPSIYKDRMNYVNDKRLGYV